MLTFRDDEIEAQHPLQRLLGTLAGCPVHRLELAPLARAAVGGCARERAPTPRRSTASPRGNPLRDRGAGVAGRRRAGERGGGGARPRPAARPGMPRGARPARRRAVAGRPRARRAAARCALRGAGRGRGGGRDRDPRRTASRSATRSRAARSSRACPRSAGGAQRGRREGPARPVAAGPRPADAPRRRGRRHRAILAFGPRAAREAAPAGSHRQALAHFETLLPHVQRLGARERAEVLDGYGWELYNAHRFRDAVAAGRRGGGALRGARRPRGRRASASCGSRATCSCSARPTRPSTARGGR